MPNGDELRRMIEELKDADALTVQAAGRGLLAPLIHERDAYMVAGLRQIAHRDPHGGKSSGVQEDRRRRGRRALRGDGGFLVRPVGPGVTSRRFAEMNEGAPQRSRRVIFGLTLAGSVLGTVYAASMVATRLRRRWPGR